MAGCHVQALNENSEIGNSSEDDLQVSRPPPPAEMVSSIEAVEYRRRKEARDCI